MWPADTIQRHLVSIDERPGIVDEGKRVGDWEMDRIIGRLGGSVLMTAVERKTRFTMIALAANKTAEAVKDTILGALSPLAAQVERLTYDKGKEFALRILWTNLTTVQENVWILKPPIRSYLDFIHRLH